MQHQQHFNHRRALRHAPNLLCGCLVSTERPVNSLLCSVSCLLQVMVLVSKMQMTESCEPIHTCSCTSPIMQVCAEDAVTSESASTQSSETFMPKKRSFITEFVFRNKKNPTEFMNKNGKKCEMHFFMKDIFWIIHLKSEKILANSERS